MKSNKLELAWAAGLWDGEGCTTLQGYNDRRTPHVKLVISQKDKYVLSRFQTAVGGGTIYGPYSRDMFYWYSNGRLVAMDVMKKIWPYLSPIKRKQFRRKLIEGGPICTWGSKRLAKDRPKLKVVPDWVRI